MELLSILTIIHFFMYLYLIFLTCGRLLNDNHLEGLVPEQIYSVGVHGGAIEYVFSCFVILCFYCFLIASSSQLEIVINGRGFNKWNGLVVNM